MRAGVDHRARASRDDGEAAAARAWCARARLVIALLALGACSWGPPEPASDGPPRPRRERATEPEVVEDAPPPPAPERCDFDATTLPPRRCPATHSARSLFDAGHGCGSDLGESFPCREHVPADLPVQSASSAVETDGFRVELVVSGFAAGEAQHVLCAYAVELRALAYRVQREPGAVRARSEVDTFEIEADGPTNGLRLTWRSVGAMDALLRNQVSTATGLPPDEELERALDDIARSMR